MSKKDILNKIKKNKDYIYNKYYVSEIGLFGSVARGEESKNSDIDILISFDKNKKVSIFHFIKTKRYFESLFSQKIDLVDKKMIKSNLKERILSEAIFL